MLCQTSIHSKYVNYSCVCSRTVIKKVLFSKKQLKLDFDIDVTKRELEEILNSISIFARYKSKKKYGTRNFKIDGAGLR